MKRFNEITLKKYLCNDRFNAYNATGKNSYEKFTRATRCKKLLRLERYTFKNVTQKYICILPIQYFLLKNFIEEFNLWRGEGDSAWGMNNGCCIVFE